MDLSHTPKMSKVVINDKERIVPDYEFLITELKPLPLPPPMVNEYPWYKGPEMIIYKYIECMQQQRLHLLKQDLENYTTSLFNISREFRFRSVLDPLQRVRGTLRSAILNNKSNTCPTLTLVLYRRLSGREYSFSQV